MGAEVVCNFLRAIVSTGIDFGHFDYSRLCSTSDRACDRLCNRDTAAIAYKTALKQFLMPWQSQLPVLDLMEHELDTEDNLEQARVFS